jgi:two-component sensor histidine kinase
VLTSVLRHEFALFESSEVLDSLTRFEARVVAFGKLHRSLAVGSASEWISIQDYIEDLSKALSEAILKALGIRCEVIADTGEFPGERCERLGLVIAELVMLTLRSA